VTGCRKENPWDFSNGILYEMCRRYPDHRRADEIIAKLLIIGRVYSAAIERGSASRGGTDALYIKKIGPAMQHAGLDKMLRRLPDGRAPWKERLVAAVGVHSELMHVWKKVRAHGKRSLASKYLHFHRRDIFPIFDSRAQVGIHRLIPRRNGLAELEVDACDETYRVFCERYLRVLEFVRERFGTRLSLRQADRLLLAIAREKPKRRKKRARTSSRPRASAH
jgi:hypothetical protein